ncbi:CYTH and CHAD domain-containing protein [Kocuria sp. cx-116]|uniref:CYTH and CHAD domain-containing protein n=1 Tax=Kocuria sp. cx-116 TaxID=2771378 RepID=UPI001689A5AD|nr:CYTH and CHAD domain-containing protein [Kocuria sp. cx-116]MBD2762435.1 CYTH and CHAD domain-containing protein [Kocuria sp. cx-116]
MAQHQWEIERKYDLPPEQAGKIKPHKIKGFRVGEPAIYDMTAVYYDTEDLALGAANVAVRRRAGGGDDGWHVKYKAGKARGELHYEPLKSSNRIPAALRKTLVGITLDEHLSPVATIKTHRTEYPIRAEDGRQHAVLCVDFVTARDERAEADREWSECETELSSDTLSKKESKAVFAAVEDVLFKAGAVQSSSPAKIARALGQDEVPAKPKRAEDSGEDAPATGQDVLNAMCETLTRQLQHWDFAVRIDAEDSVHQMRVRSRALRSVLHAARNFIPEHVGTDLEDRLKTLARALSDARDEEVAAEQLHERLDGEFQGQITASARQDLFGASETGIAHAARAVRRMLESPAHLQLLKDLRALSRDSSFGEQAAHMSAKKFAKAVMSTALTDVIHKATAEPTVDSQTGRAEVSELGAELSERLASADEDSVGLAIYFDHLHDARKAIKSVRYVSDALDRADVEPGKKRSRAASYAKDYQNELGSLTDCAVMEHWLARVARSFQRTGKDRYAVGLLHGLEMASLRARLDDAPELISDLVADIRRELPSAE